MKPGRELDAWVAEKVMGWVDVSKEHHWNYIRGCSAGWPDEYSGLPPDGYTGDDEFKRDYRRIPNYSTSIADAWVVVEKLASTYLFCLENSGSFWVADFGRSADRRAQCTAGTAPHAICLAALKAVGYERVEP